MHAAVINNKKRRQRLGVYLFVLPAFLLHFIFVLAPSVSTVYFSFFNWNGIGKATFIGLSNYKEMFADSEFTKALSNNLKSQIAITSWTLRGKNLGHGWSRRIYP